MIRLDSGATINGLEITKLPPIPEVVWQQPLETHLIDIHEKLITETNNSTHTPKLKRRIDEKSQMSAVRETSPQMSRSSTEPILENQTRSTPVQCCINSKKQHFEIQKMKLT